MIFDLGSTLIDFDGDYERVFPQSLTAIADNILAHSPALDREAFIQRFGQALMGYYDQRDDDCVEHSTYAILCDVLEGMIDPLPDETVLRQGLAAMYGVSEAHWKTKPATHAVLKQLFEDGYRLGLLSNAGDEANVQRLIDSAGIREYFDPILISAALGIRKPHPGPFLQILEYWNIPTEAAVMVGDLLEADILGANKAGIRSIWLRDGSEPEVDLDAQNPQPDRVAEGLAEVPDLIYQMSQKG